MKISLNGVEYDSWDDLPPEIRRQLADVPQLRDTDHDGVPDGLAALVEQARSDPAGGHGSTTIRTTSSVTVDGRTYGSLDDVPEPLRAALERAGVFTDGPSRQPAGMPHFATDPTPQAPVLLNGQPVEADQRPAKRRWWKRA